MVTRRRYGLLLCFVWVVIFLENTNINKKFDSVALDLMYEQLLESTEEYSENAQHIDDLVKFFKNRGYLNFAEELHDRFYSMEEEHQQELVQLENIKAMRNAQFAADLQHRVLYYKQSQ
jgi:hypothetical protein